MVGKHFFPKLNEELKTEFYLGKLHRRIIVFYKNKSARYHATAEIYTIYIYNYFLLTNIHFYQLSLRTTYHWNISGYENIK